MDTQIVELLGRHQLIKELLRAELEVAVPVRDRGVDVIAYADLGTKVQRFVGCPIQMKAAISAAFSIDRKYERFPNLIIALVWNLQSENATVTYALTHDEAVSVASQMGYTATRSWIEDGRYEITRPSQKLIAALESYRMTPANWWRKVTGLEMPM